MTPQLLQLVLFQAFAVLLVYSCYCRATRISKQNTQRPIRWAFTTLGVVGSLCMFAPLIAAYQPDGLTTALLGAITLTQLVTAHHWRAGVPPPFRKGD